MLYKFKSKVASDVIMMGPGGDQMLGLIGKEVTARGIIEPEQMAAAIQALEQAVADDEAPRPDGDGAEDGQDGDEGGRRTEGVSLRQRVWPMIDMMKKSQAANVPIVWGV